MLELLAVITFFGYIYYLRNYADLRSKSEKEESEFSSGIDLYNNGRFDDAFLYFDQKVEQRPGSCVAYLYRGLCYKSKNLTSRALADIEKAVSLDDEVYQAHMQLGILHLQTGNPEKALASLDKAVMKAQGITPEPHHWRSQAYSHLNRVEESKADLEMERLMIRRTENKPSGLSESSAPFVDKKLMVSMLMVVFTSVLVVAVVKRSEGVHIPYFVAVICSIAIGFAEPRKGWVLALLQSILVLGVYFLFTSHSETTNVRELEKFSLYGSVILTFVASFLGGFMKRAFSM
jgi:tetratricopeptide (TPR) repeat protein